MTEPVSLAAIPPGAEALAIARLLSGDIPPLPEVSSVLHVSISDRGMDQVAQALPFFLPEVEIIRVPAWDCLPYDRISPRASLMAERVQALAALATRPASAKRKLAVLTTVNSILQRVPSRELLARSHFEIRKGASVNRDRLVEFLQQNGYRRAGKAIEAGEFSLRGGIIDIIPSGETQGVRLDFFGDEVESLRVFDPMTQLTTGESGGLTLSPVSEVMLHEESINLFRARYREQFGAVSKEDPLYEAISAGSQYPGFEHWLPLFHERLDTLMDYVPDALLTFEAQAEATIEERQETIRDHYGARVEALTAKSRQDAPYHPMPPEQMYLMPANWEAQLHSYPACWFSSFEADKNGFSLGAKPSPNLAQLRHGPEINPFDQFRDYAEARRAQGKAAVLAALTNGSADRLTHLLSTHSLHPVRVENAKEAQKISGRSIGVTVLPLPAGFETEKLAILTEQDLLGERIIRARAKKKAPERFLAEAANFLEGELVVHRDHGIGRYAGLETLEVPSPSGVAVRHDCLKIIYDGDDRLFLPVENIDLISRYGSEDEGVKLDRLGAASWQARKAKLKERIKIAAEALLKTAAERATRTAPQLAAHTGAYETFCDRFPYMETEDQQRSIDEVLEDMQSGRPMDRLICGDVGFGKTEVALRAAFVAINPVAHAQHASTGSHAEMERDPALPLRGPQDKTQVAVVVPTTLLARQHYKNFRDRFEGFGVRVAQLSRMVPASEQKKVREGLKDGSVDIVVGTHALLSKQVEFSRLGLVIVDEEQHFGVGQKEKLKELKADVHVLTLSATPIPRTLQMALTGVRSLSLITTPPVDRLVSRSFVMPWDPVVLREAILREKHRGGRVFLVTPRVRDIGDLKARLTELVPEVKVGVAHGQLPASELDQIMNDFHDGKFDLLLSTAIVESGLDIPTANTMIINRADRFGLSQLYQLRGRVGRGKLRAYAYFILPSYREMSQNATRRLEVMQSLDSLGAGFTVASHDMDIRGFGNLVGEEQSGHIKEVGIELYQQMLEEAVSILRRGGAESAGSLADVVGDPAQSLRDSQDWSPQINLGLSILIPENYVSDLQLRLGLYRRAAYLRNEEELEAFAAELIDRFGPLPEEVKHLLSVMSLKLLCKRAGIERLDKGPKGAVITFREGAIARPETLLAYIGKHPTTLKLRPDQKLVYMREWEERDSIPHILAKLAGDISAATR